MSRKTTKALVPKLRFPEFRDTGDWSNKPLEELYSFKTTNSYSRDMLNYKKGSVKNIHYGDIHTKFSTLFDIENEIVPFINSSVSLEKIKSDCYCMEGDIVFADASEDLDDVGKSIEIVRLNNEKLLSGLHTLLARQKDRKLVVGFGGYLFKSSPIRAQVKKEAQGAKVFGISAGRLSNIKISFPNDKKEQQKISDCLSCIDELITAQAQKIESLKAHKKGLMQQLFPAEGETLPKLRFPEFRGAGAWKKQKVSSLLARVSEPVNVDLNETYRQIGIRSHGKGIFYKELVNGKELGNKRVFWVEEDALIVNIVFAWEQAVAITSEKEIGMIASHRFPMYKAKLNKSDVNFIKHYFLTRKGKELLGVASPGGAGRNKTLGQKEFERLELILPEKVEEQIKIAECLSSIDALITVQAQKVEVLKAHKKGLMQQLFPSISAVNG